MKTRILRVSFLLFLPIRLLLNLSQFLGAYWIVGRIMMRDRKHGSTVIVHSRRHCSFHRSLHFFFLLLLGYLCALMTWVALNLFAEFPYDPSTRNDPIYNAKTYAVLSLIFIPSAPFFSSSSSCVYPFFLHLTYPQPSPNTLIDNVVNSVISPVNLWTESELNRLDQKEKSGQRTLSFSFAYPPPSSAPFFPSLSPLFPPLHPSRSRSLDCSEPYPNPNNFMNALETEYYSPFEAAPPPDPRAPPSFFHEDEPPLTYILIFLLFSLPLYLPFLPVIHPWPTRLHLSLCLSFSLHSSWSNV